jgi:hypothetical protein
MISVSVSWFSLPDASHCDLAAIKIMCVLRGRSQVYAYVIQYNSWTVQPAVIMILYTCNGGQLCFPHASVSSLTLTLFLL